MLKSIALMAVVLTLSACATGNVLEKEDAKTSLIQRASFDMSCPKNQINVQKLGQGIYGASGCDKRETYVLRGCGVHWYSALTVVPVTNYEKCTFLKEGGQSANLILDDDAKAAQHAAKENTQNYNPQTQSFYNSPAYTSSSLGRR